MYFIGGNHDSYHSDIDETADTYRNFLAKQGHNAHFLEDEVVELAPGTFMIASTLWTDMAQGTQW